MFDHWVVPDQCVNICQILAENSKMNFSLIDWFIDWLQLTSYLLSLQKQNKSSFHFCQFYPFWGHGENLNQLYFFLLIVTLGEKLGLCKGVAVLPPLLKIQLQK